MITFESLDTQSSFLVGGYIFRGYRSSHGVKVKVTAARKLKIPYSRNVGPELVTTTVLYRTEP